MRETSPSVLLMAKPSGFAAPPPKGGVAQVIKKSRVAARPVCQREALSTGRAAPERRGVLA
ncbi:TPA_asm: hypothetical protein G0K65_23680 [Salmonella enterica subsp. enterica serovar Typhimurium]|uniref:Uncharacterized protein n=1 Tax=Salmonella typhimurium TaxID=90371 RepID=A0A707JZW2_SALTM|nr:hypothetical protein [Salmonella enterica subsp. enterica serovar Typhimurium]